jgi:hypothetical protein
MKNELVEIGFPINLAASFEELPAAVLRSDASSTESLLEAFKKVFHSPPAKANRDVVFVWAVDNPYTHDIESRSQSKLVYIEKTKWNIATRWRTSGLRLLTADHEDGEVRDTSSLRSYADVNRNWSFYSRLIQKHGPMRIWWATCQNLNELSGWMVKDSEGWEQHLLALYQAKHGCRPLKNRVGGKLYKA